MHSTEAAVTKAPGRPAPVVRARPHDPSRRVLRGIQIGIAVLAVAAVVTGGVLFGPEGSIFLWQGQWLVRELVPGTITFAVVGVLVLRRPQAAAVGWVMLGMAAVWGASAALAGLFVLSFETGWEVTAQLFIASLIGTSAGWTLGVIILPQVFPTGWLSGWFWRLLLLATALIYLLMDGLNAMVNWEGFFPSTPAPIELETLHRLATIGWYTSLLVALASMVERIRRGPRLVRQQVAPFAAVWLITVVAAEARSVSVDDTDSSWAYAAIWLWPVAAAVVIGVTATQVGLWDTRLVVRRFAVYALMVFVLTGLFAGVYFVMLLVLASPVVGDHYRWLALLVAAVAVIIADPLRRRLHALLERHLLGERGDPLRPLARLDALISASAIEESAVYRMITKTVAEAVRSPGVALAIHRSPTISEVAIAGREPTDPLVVALLHRGERLGELRVGSRTPGEPYGRSDRALLARLASQIAAAVYGLRRDTDIAALRSEAIEALVEQRRNLGRDLHDGLAPLLAGAGLTADALRRGMPVDSPDAAEAARLSARLRAAASEVRRLSHDLQPAPDAGQIGAAITDYAASVTGPDAPEITVALDDLGDAGLTPTAVLGLIRVGLEAMTNAVRHAHARRITVSVRLLPHEVELAVADDGVGIPQPYVSGLGITSMRSRVQALGGVFELGPGVAGGTRLTARVPIPR